VKLLLDENLSDRIVSKIVDLYPDSSHVKAEGLEHADDTAVWNFAKQNSFAIVSKDADFHQRSLVHGHPPKFIFLRIGNCPTSTVTQLLRDNASVLATFDADPALSLLVLS
jgi:predicted nuclease of predicted toxin-antitoxin system